MRRAFGILLILLVFQLAPAAAEPPPYIEFIRGLRNEGFTDLAMEYLEKLRVAPPAEIADLLPLEHARTLLEMAIYELDESKRATLLAQAKQEFEGYLQKNADHPEATVELARLQSQLARVQLNRSRRRDDPATRAVEAEKARPLFEAAAKRFQKAETLLEEEEKKLRSTKNYKGSGLISLQDAEARCRLEEMINLYYISETYLKPEQDQQVAKAAAVKKARSGFAAIYESNEVVDRYGWIALAWYCHLTTLMDDPLVAGKRFEELFKAFGDPKSAEGIRIGKYFKIRHIIEDRDDGAKLPGDKFANASRLSAAWLKEYAAFRDTNEGLGVRFIYAICQQNLAERDNGIKRNKDGKVTGISSVAVLYLSDAAQYFKELAEFENEYSERAARRRQEILVELADGEPKSAELSPASLTSFNRCLLQAQIEEARLSIYLRKSAEADPKKIKEEEKLRIARAIAFLERGLQIISPKDSAKDVFEARLFLTRCYLYGGQPMFAAVYGENLGKSFIRLSKAATACELAVQGYNRAAADANGQGEIGKNSADADVQRLKKLAEFMDATWPDENATDTARQIWAWYTLRDKNYPLALSIYARIHPTYSGVCQARLQQGGALFTLIRGDADPARLTEIVPAQIKKYAKEWKETLASLRSLTEPSATSAFSETQCYFLAKLQLCQLLILEGKNYKDVEMIAAAADKSLIESVAFTGRENDRKEIDFSIKSMRLNGIQGQASQFLLQGQLSKVSDLVKAPVAAIKKEVDEFNDEKNKDASAALEQIPTFERYRRSERDILIIALRTSVQESKLDEAAKLMDTLEKTGGSAESRLANLRSLVSTVRTQYDLLTRSGKAEPAKKLAEGFGKFLDQLGSQPKQSPAMQTFLAQGYGAIDQHAKSVDLLEKLLKSLPDPKGVDPADPAVRTYRQTQYALARSYRLAKEYEKAKDFLDKKMIGSPMAKGPFYSSVEARKERALLYEDMKDIRSAVTYWTNMAKMFGEPLPPPNPTNDADARKRDLYFELFYEAQRCSAKGYADLDKKKYEAQIDKGYTAMAQRLYDLETKNPDLSIGLKDKLRELIEEYKPLRDKYKALGGKLLESN